MSSKQKTHARSRACVRRAGTMSGYSSLSYDRSVDKIVLIAWALKVAKLACYVVALLLCLNIVLSLLEAIIPALFLSKGHPGISLAPTMFVAEALGRWRLGMPMNGMQQGSFQVAMTLSLLDANPTDKRRFLCFGVGFDSSWWRHMIEDVRGGKAVFVEDNAAWMRIVLERDAMLVNKVHHVHYHTKMASDPEKGELGLSAEEKAWLDPSSTSFCSLHMTLPSAVPADKYDVVMVDGPAGAGLGDTGRYQAILAAVQLVAPGGFVVVDDCERPVERAFADRFLGANNFVAIRSRPRILNRQPNSQCFYHAPRAEALPGAAAVCGNKGIGGGGAGRPGGGHRGAPKA